MSDGDADADRYRLVGNNHYHDGERLRRGDVFEPTDAELRDFGHKFEPVDDADTEAATESDDADADADAEDESEAEDGDDDFDADEFVDRTPMKVVTNDLESGDYDDHLDEIEEAAERKGVLDAVADRR